MYEGKKVAIAGFGLEGQAALKFFKSRGAEVAVFDHDASKLSEVPKDVDFFSGQEAFEDFSQFDLVSRTPSMNPNLLKGAKETTSITNEFFKLCPAPIIGVTGTKGKGTTASLIAKILEESGQKVHLLGNIGTPALNELDEVHEDDIVVYELSSFQLWDMTTSPHIAVVLMIAEEHMDIHEDMDDYVGAKANIAKHQTENDTVIYHPTNEHAIAIAEQSAGQHLKYMTQDGALVVGDTIMLEGMAVMDTHEVALIGPHNLENVCAAITAAWEFTTDIEAIKRAVSSFRGLSHRLEMVDEKDGVKYFDDSISTTPESAIAALVSFEEPKIMILGGSSKNSDFSELAVKVNEADIRAVITLGDEAPTIGEALHGVGFDESKVYNGVKNMGDVVRLASELAQSGDVVVLSPACASFDMFDNYADRGDQFKQAVSEL